MMPQEPAWRDVAAAGEGPAWTGITLGQGQICGDEE
jgi:hypothetical protein